MKPFDPDFSEISNEQLAEIDSLCSRYEAKRTQGLDVSIESFLADSDIQIRSLLKLELIQVELEILDAWDQLTSADSMLHRFPEAEEFIRKQWESLKTRSRHPSLLPDREDTKKLAASVGSTLNEGPSAQRTQDLDDDQTTLVDPSPRFHTIRNLAQGGIGTVFVAFDHDLQREVAIKELKRRFVDDRAVVKRFEAEASITGTLEHPNIVPIYATGRRSDGRPYYAMRLIQGRSMQAVISELHSRYNLDLDFRKVPAARDLMLRFVAVCRAISFAHNRGVLHRDLKPSNIMVGDFGETLVVDWGLARKLQISDSCKPLHQLTEAIEHGTDNTQHGTIVGTPGYMSPEQAIGHNEEITIASDIYSLGATLFQILTNTVPAIPSVSTLQGENKANKREFQIIVPGPLGAICRKAMQIQPNARYATAEQMAIDVEAWLMDEPVSVHPETRIQKIRRWARNHSAVVTGGIVSLIIAMIAMGATLTILSVKNESLRLSNLREQTFARESLQNATIAKMNGDEAVRQRQRVFEILNTFLIDVERGLANVPGSAAVQRNVLTTVLNKLSEISKDFSDDQVTLSSATALVELGGLFSRVGTKDIQLESINSKELKLSPLEAAGEMYAEAMKIVNRVSPQSTDPRAMIATIKQKQAEVLRQLARTPEALELLNESLAMRRVLLAENPDSMEAALDVATSVDYQGQIHLQNGDFASARVSFDETRSILTRLSKQSPSDLDIKRRLGIALSRIADIAIHNGELELAEQLYNQDLAISIELHSGRPNNLTAKRDLCTSLDRIGNISAKRGQLEKALVSYLESRRLREELYAAEPANSKTIHDLFVSFMKAGDTRMLLNEIADAKADYEKSLNLADEMARLDPQSATAKRFQSLCAEVLADVAISQSQLDDALKYSQKSLAISQELVAKDPTVGQMQRDLYICYAKVAKVFLAKRDFQNCQAQLDLALSVVQPIYERQPESLQLIGDYSFVLLKRAEAHLEAGESLPAIQELTNVIPLLESIVEASSQDAKSRRRLANAITMLGRAQVAEGQTSDARQSLERSRQLTTAMIEEGMRVEQMQLDLAEIDSLLAGIVD